MIKHKFIIALFTLCYLLTACVAEDLQGPVAGSGEGYLVLQLGSVSAEVQSAPLTKATTTLTELGVPLPSVDQFTITIKDSNGSTVKTGLYRSLKSSPIVLPVGTYTVEASHGDNRALQDKPYFYGSGSVTITTGSNTILLTPKLANAVIIPVVTNDLQKHYNDGWTLTANNKPLDKTSNGIQMFYAKARETISFTFQGTNKAGQQSTTTWTAISNVSACTAYTVQCDPDLSAFSQIEVKATATHTYDASGYLNGTDIVLDSNLNGANKEAIQTWNVQVMYNGTPIRTYSGTVPNQLTMTKTNEWPYIPQGSTLSASVTLKAGNIITVGANMSLPTPTFGVEVTGTTSYDKYLANDISGANGMNAETIEGIGATAQISEELLSQFSHSFSLIFENEEYNSENSMITVGDKTVQIWGNHPITATMIFDGQSIETSKDCHITGLPYKPSNMIEADWKLESLNNKYKDGVIQLGGISGSGECSASSQMTFHIPQNINIQINSNVTVRDYFYDVWPLKKWCETTFTVSVNSVSIITQPGNHEDNNNTGKNYDLMGSAEFSPNTASIKLNSSYKAAGPWSKVYTLYVLYR